jgi:hypothetical protein
MLLMRKWGRFLVFTSDFDRKMGVRVENGYCDGKKGKNVYF